MRNAARLKAGYYPLPQREAERMKNFLIFGGQETAVVDPCAGTGAALRLITDGEKIIRHGIELDAYRADRVRKNFITSFNGNAFRRSERGRIVLRAVHQPSVRPRNWGESNAEWSICSWNTPTAG